MDAVTGRLFPSTGITPWWLLPDDMPYLWRYLPFHLRRAGRLDELTGLITDLRWVEEKTRRFGSVAAVLTDLELSEANTARTLARHLDRAAPLLGPIDPSPALGATLASRLHGVVELEPVGVLSERARAPSAGAGLATS
ncbi:hypothetical protein V2I01_38310 [Micromonospora sp. BRA006-A]|nr:hypothetical protein [Micromonospora sp. BRA006-A]